jgi:serine/threonine protein kinase
VKYLGKGGFGNVSLYYDNISKKEVAIKKIIKTGKERDELRFYREIYAMKSIKCPYSVEYYDYYSDNDFYYIVMEKCDGDLKSYLKKFKDGLSDSVIKGILLQLNEVFKIMLSKNIIHRDLKPRNILIKYVSKNDFNIKLADFGLSREFINQSFSTHAGTPVYKAPELINQKHYDPNKCDLWAIGVLIYNLKFKEVADSFYYGEIPKRFDNKLLDDLVRKLIVVDQKERIDWNDYFNHPFFKN